MKQGDQVGTIVGSSVHLTGAIKDASDINIFGSVEGEVNSDERVVIEETANVKGPVTAREIIVSGYINGTVTARERLELNSSGTIKGNIDTKELLIHSGATFVGKSSMPEKDSSHSADDNEIFEAELDSENPEEKPTDENEENNKMEEDSDEDE
jgi:cytoskeletal protein CcmA (bactofilin family)